MVLCQSLRGDGDGDGRDRRRVAWRGRRRVRDRVCMFGLGAHRCSDV